MLYYTLKCLQASKRRKARSWFLTGQRKRDEQKKRFQEYHKLSTRVIPAGKLGGSLRSRYFMLELKDQYSLASESERKSSEGRVYILDNL